MLPLPSRLRDSDKAPGEFMPDNIATEGLRCIGNLLGCDTPFRLAGFCFGGTIAAYVRRRAQGYEPG